MVRWYGGAGTGSRTAGSVMSVMDAPLVGLEMEFGSRNQEDNLK
jgi:hypothetical protein